jgi:hypothetical protein
MSALHDLFSSIAEIIRLGASLDLREVSFEIDADDIERDLSYGR